MYNKKQTYYAVVNKEVVELKYVGDLGDKDSFSYVPKDVFSYVDEDELINEVIGDKKKIFSDYATAYLALSVSKGIKGIEEEVNNITEAMLTLLRNKVKEKISWFDYAMIAVVAGLAVVGLVSLLF